VLSCVTQLVQALKDAQTKVQEIREPLTNLFEMDDDHDQSISCAEYTNFMLQQMQLVDPDVIEHLQEQFRQLDTDGNGVLTMAGVCVHSEN
jgi:benzoyl-CoA reductase/2-hydroxyglutaryl-CoA dehydratase subunit BcrC/BadD/HgdB